MAQRLSLAFTILLSVLFAFCCSANARKDSGDYWKGVMKDEPMPAALEALVLPNPAQKSSLVKKPNCSTKDDQEANNSLAEKPGMSKSFEPRLTISSYHDEPVAESFQPRPNISAYGD
ncbi:unnamed protein product [Rhodiola kirilowii]